MQKIVITGGNGQLGSELKVLSKLYSQFDWVFTDWQELDLCNLDALEKSISSINPQIIINCAAHTAVDKAESEVELSDILNHQSVAIMAKWSFQNNCKFLHVSTDYVFDGNSSIALTEEAATNPINVYGVTKLAGEKACLKNNPDAIIIRTSWVYSSFGNNFVKTMSRLMQERDTLSVVNDQIGSPTYAADLAAAIMTIIAGTKWEAGIFNFSNEGEISWYQFALAIQEIGKFDCDVSGIPGSNYPTPAKRPSFSLLDKSKIKTTYAVLVPDYKVSLAKCMAILES
ncbi:dTDP-4-dehydrorhamnose reductase [Flavobacterium sp. 7A]|uniref:dTDP-4-dehydrorhamnose reductase n=1 Tax=Flavobacterium sp. 7A TaxID=2940571 RepID=UPI002227215C|nr:dTDP-4-dehydrorhamnose reductase [Flavobacterium sp. 7A]MCW2119425.1 dTDP-4-dehydrorhamnose reductase [Flavobacterium sp. 7A]